MLELFLQEPEAAGCRSLRRVVCSGEVLSRSLTERFHQVLPCVELFNLYGPTEASIDVTHWRCAPGEAGDVPIGRPVWNTAAWVLDEGFQPVPLGTTGELYLSGVQLALGYVGQAGLTAERFLPDPWGPPGTRMYRTGDLVRRRADGALVYLGRNDDQVKIRGLRVELGEIENVLTRHPEVTSALAMIRGDRLGEQRLTVYVTGGDGARLEPEELRELAASVLPDYMVPSHVVPIDRFPTTTSGKVDRKSLPAPEAPRRRTGEPAKTEREAVLCSIYAELLGLDDVTPLDDFFVLGGDSIGSIHVVSRARRAGLLLTARQVFEHRTPRALARVAGAAGAEADPADGNGVGVVPLTPIMRWWRGGGGPTAGFHQSMLLSTPRGLTERQLTDVLQALLDRHDMLRATLVRTPESQEVLEVPAPGAVPAGDLLVLVREAGNPEEAAVRTRFESEAAARLVPERGRMVAAVWLDEGPARRGQLLLLVHHLAVDGVSWRILRDDLVQAWQAVARSQQSRLDPVPVSFKRWARLLHDAAGRPDREAELAHWERATSATALADLPRDPRRDTTERVVSVSRTLPADLTAQLLGPVPATFHTGPEQVLLTGLALAVTGWQTHHEATRHHPLSIHLEGHGRESSLGDLDLSRTVGWFTCLYPVLLDVTGIDAQEALRGGPAAGTALKQVKEQLAAVPDRGVGHGLLRWLNPRTGPALSAPPEPWLGFNYLGRFTTSAAEDTDQNWAAVPGEPLMGGGAPAGTPVPHLLDVVAITEDGPGGPRLTADFSWPAGLFTEREVSELADRWTSALAGLARHGAEPDAGGVTPSDLTLSGLTQQEIDELEAELAWNGEGEL